MYDVCVYIYIHYIYTQLYKTKKCMPVPTVWCSMHWSYRSHARTFPGLLGDPVAYVAFCKDPRLSHCETASHGSRGQHLQLTAATVGSTLRAWRLFFAWLQKLFCPGMVPPIFFVGSPWGWSSYRENQMGPVSADRTPHWDVHVHLYWSII